MTEDEEVFGLDDELPSWTEDDLDDVPEELDGLDDAGLLEDPLPAPPPADIGLPEDPLPAPPLGEVGLLAHGKAIWVTQRPKPYTNCMFASVCVVLSFMGYALPDDFVLQLRGASGVDPHRATSTGDTKTALNQLIPHSPIKFGGLDKDVMLRMLADGEIVVRVQLHVGLLPDGPVRKHFKPGFVGGHAVALAGAERLPNGDFNLLWMDPMGRPVNTYEGIRVPFSEIKDALLLTPSGKIRVTFGFRDAALP